MKSDEVNSVLGLAYRDTPTIEYPCATLIQTLMHDISVSREVDDIVLDKFTDYIIIELEVTKSAFWCYEKNLFEKLIFDSEVFLISHSEKLSDSSNKLINDCIELLNFLAGGQENWSSLPNKFKDFEDMQFCVNGNKEIRIDEFFRNPNVKCPSCSHEFSQIAFDVVRTIFAVRCPKCEQSIAR
ncbi:hypothetical protein [Limnohabitans sp. Hippo4]|uniref:hypothetical protein n=1 Tax=Limnohabitans sp. Hippo4 TaxID=1826167 RepID=UPI0011B297B9|nr:hypothetical protein [Limnohabitans sp. Hippo4]